MDCLFENGNLPLFLKNTTLYCKYGAGVLKFEFALSFPSIFWKISLKNENLKNLHCLVAIFLLHSLLFFL